MPRKRHVSEGHLAIYGRRELNEHDRMLDWRAVMHNETKGMPERDNHGSNAGASLFWLPYSPNRDRYSARHARTHWLHVPANEGVHPTRSVVTR